MALVLADRVKETTTTTGTGTVTLLGASTGFQSFAVVGNTNTTYYTIAAQTGTEWEVGIGTYTLSGTTLARTTVLSSSNSGSPVNFSAGTKDVFVTYPSSRSVYANGTVLTATNSSILPVTSGGTGVTTSTGTTNVVLSNSPTLVTPALGAATATSLVSSGTAASSFTVTSGTAVPLTITNVGTGNSFVVEDSANPDATPFVIDAAGSVGIGAVPTSAAKANITSNSAGASTIALSLQNAQNTISSETVLDLVPNNNGAGVRSAQISAINTDGSSGVNMVFKISNGAPAAECMRISSAGIFLFNNTVVNGQSSAKGIQNNSTTVLESFSTTAGTSQQLNFTKSANATAGSQTLVSNADELGEIRSFGSDGTTYRQATQIQFNVDGGTPSSTSMPGRVTFLTSASGSVSPTERIRIDSAGLTTVTGTLKVTTGAAVGGATAGTGGLAFPATAVAVADANTLDDYEEGTWTPVVTFTGGNGDLTTAEANGVYTKIGRLVQIAFNVEFTETTALTNLTITGVPFTSGGSVRTFVGCWVDNMTTLVGSPTVGIGTSTTTITLNQTTTGAATQITNLNTATSSRVRGSLSYSI